MPQISDAAIAGAAKGSGLNANQTAIAVAIALAESGGNTTSHNGVPPDDSYGLWQINMLGSMGPSRRQQFGITTNEELYSPSVNAKAMFMLSNGGQNWRPWTTYTRGTYLRFMARGQAVAGTSATQPGTVAPGGATTPVSLSDSLTSITNFLAMLKDPKYWLRLALIAVGAGLAFYGLMKLTGNNQLADSTKSVGKAAIGLIPGGGTVVEGTKAAVKVAT